MPSAGDWMAARLWLYCGYQLIEIYLITKTIIVVIVIKKKNK